MTTTAVVTTKPLSPESFIAGMFSFEPDMLCPLELLPDYLTNSDFRSLTEELDLQGEMVQHFSSILAVSALGQYSLLRETDICAIARLDGYFRQAMPEEAQEDFVHFREQVMGEEIKTPEKKYRAYVKFFDSKYFYTGPERVVRMICTTRIFPGGMPDMEKIEQMIQEVTEAIQPVKDEDEETAFARYYFIFASRGKIQIRAFGKLEALKLDDLQFLGEMEFSEGKLLFFPEGNRSSSVDFSEHLQK